MIKWRPWPPLLSKKVDVKVVVKRLDGWCSGDEDNKENDKMVVEMKWKGPKIGLTSFRRTVKKNVTKQGLLRNGVVEWDEEFFSVCTLSGYKHNVFHPWEITLTLLNVSFSFSVIPFFFMLCVYMFVGYILEFIHLLWGKEIRGECLMVC